MKCVIKLHSFFILQVEGSAVGAQQGPKGDPGREENCSRQGVQADAEPEPVGENDIQHQHHIHGIKPFCIERSSTTKPFTKDSKANPKDHSCGDTANANAISGEYWYAASKEFKLRNWASAPHGRFPHVKSINVRWHADQGRLRLEKGDEVHWGHRQRLGEDSGSTRRT
jgi:hypothetical protein